MRGDLKEILWGWVGLRWGYVGLGRVGLGWVGLDFVVYLPRESTTPTEAATTTATSTCTGRYSYRQQGIIQSCTEYSPSVLVTPAIGTPCRIFAMYTFIFHLNPFTLYLPRPRSCSAWYSDRNASQRVKHDLDISMRSRFLYPFPRR